MEGFCGDYVDWPIQEETVTSPPQELKGVEDTRPQMCRFRLQEEGKAYPRSSCQACHATLFNLGKFCKWEQVVVGERPYDLVEKAQMLAQVNVEKTYKFNIDAVKELIIDYVARVEGKTIRPNDISVSVSEASYAQYDSSPAQADFTAKVKV